MDIPQPVQNFVGDLQSNDITLVRASGKPVLRLRMLHGAALVAAGVLIAPRLTALAATGALLKGMSLRVEGPVTETPLS